MYRFMQAVNNPEIKIELERRARQTKNLHERLRLCVILARSEGMSHESIAQAHRISVSSVYQYLMDFEKENKTQHQPKEGTKSKLSPEQTKELLKHLQEFTFFHTKDICKYVEEKYAVKYSKSGIHRWLKEHDFVYKEPIKTPGKLDPKKQEAFIEYYNKLKKYLGSEEEILFLDAVHPNFNLKRYLDGLRREKLRHYLQQISNLDYISSVR